MINFTYKFPTFKLFFAAILLIVSSFSLRAQSCQGYGVSIGNAPCNSVYGTYFGSVTASININCSCSGPFRYVLCTLGGTVVASYPSATTYYNSPPPPATFSPLALGTYVMYFVTPAYPLALPNFKGCPNSQIQFTIGEPNALSATVSSLPTSCSYSTDGSITVNNVFGGTAPYNVSWIGPDMIYNDPLGDEVPSSLDSYTINNLQAGNYIVNITDFNGCPTVSYNITVDSPDPISASLSSTNANCDNTTGSIQVAVDPTTGTNGGAGYNISWQPTAGSLSNPVGTEIEFPLFNPYTITGVVPNTSYTIYVTDDNNCLASLNTSIGSNNPVPVINGNNLLCVGDIETLTVGPSFTGANPWLSSNVFVADINPITGNVTGLSQGSTTISYTASTGCIGTFPLSVNSNPSFILTSTSTEVCDGTQVSLTATSNPTSTYDFDWYVSGNATPFESDDVVQSSSINVSPNTTTTYIATATNPVLGCESSQSVTVTVNPTPVITGDFILCTNSTTQLYGSGTAATTNPWTSSNVSVATINSLGEVNTFAAGNTTITYTDNEGCQDFVILTVSAPPTANLGYNASYCNDLFTEQPVAITGTGSYLGGSFSSSPSGLSLNASTGAIIPGSSTPGA